MWLTTGKVPQARMPFPLSVRRSAKSPDNSRMWGLLRKQGSGPGNVPESLQETRKKDINFYAGLLHHLSALFPEFCLNPRLLHP
jgi:hypothetical protein